MAYTLVIRHPELMGGAGDLPGVGGAQLERFVAALIDMGHSALEIDILSDRVEVQIPWSTLAEVGSDLLLLARSLDLEVQDPQHDRQLSAPMADTDYWRRAARPGVEATRRIKSAIAASDGSAVVDEVRGVASQGREALSAPGVAFAGPIGDVEGFLVPLYFGEEDRTGAAHRAIVAGLGSRRVEERRLAAFQSGGWPTDSEILDALRRVLRGDRDAHVRAYAVQSLGILGDEDAGHEMLATATDLSARVTDSDSVSAHPMLSAAYGCAALAAQARSSALRNQIVAFLQDASGAHSSLIGDSVRSLLQRLSEVRPLH